jgi:putative transposase
MPYWQLFYHIVWATKNREPLLTAESESTVYGFLRTKAIGLGATVFALNGLPDHVHLVAAIPPKIAVAKFIGQIKAVAATKFNKLSVSQTPLFWQDEYGVFSFDRKRLPNYVNYVERQKEHHAEARIIPILERLNDIGVQMVKEPLLMYEINLPGWRDEPEAYDRANSTQPDSSGTAT